MRVLAVSVGAFHTMRPSDCEKLEQQHQTVVLWAPSHTPPATRVDASRKVVEDLGGNVFVSRMDAKDPGCPEVVDTHTVFKDFLTATFNPIVEVIWAVQGGRMGLRLWPLLDAHRDILPKQLPLLVGFSDITSLHLWFNEQGYPTIHAPVLAFCKETGQGVNTKTSVGNTVWPLITGKTTSLTYTGLLPINWNAKVMEDLPCVVMRGNLSSLHYWSTAYGPLKREHILVIETWDDATRMDSILLSLKLGDFFENTKAIIFGSMHGKTPGDEGFEEIQARCALLIRSFAEDLGIPVFSTKPSKNVPSDLIFGHGTHNDPIPFGTPSTLKFDETRPGFTLTMAAPPLRRDSPQ